jgi:hypothetical protein
MPRAEAPSCGARGAGGKIPRPSLTARIPYLAPAAITEIGIAAFYPSVYSRSGEDVAFLDDAASLSA